MGDSGALKFDWTEEPDGQPFTPLKRKRKARRLEYVGWGSKQLIEFLDSIGVDTSKEISLDDVSNIVSKYVNDHNLRHPKNKKRIVCDEALLNLFGRKTLMRIKINEFLEPHFVANGDDDSLFGSSDEDSAGERTERPSVIRNATKEKVPDAPKSPFAAIVAENIKLLYLKRSVVQNLLKEPETFEHKIIGSLVRIKADPNDYLRKSTRILVLVTGLKKVAGTDNESEEFLLEVSNFIRDVPISLLSDDNFSQEECLDLRQRVKDGLLKRPTIVEAEEKAQILHKDITKHWIQGELSLLQKLIDRANEKGWRRELSEYLDRRQLLQTPAEQTRLLCEVPKVIPDEIEVESTPLDFPVDAKFGNIKSPTSTLNGAPETPVCDAAAAKTSTTWIPCSTDSQANKPVGDGEHDAFVEKQQKQPADSKANKSVGDGEHDISAEEQHKRPAVIHVESSGLPVNTEESKHPQQQDVADMEVIDLSDDEEDEDSGSCVEILDDAPGSQIWNYVDPQGDVQGPFSIKSLQRWSQCYGFPPDFKVWKTGESREEAVLLTDVLGGL